MRFLKSYSNEIDNGPNGIRTRVTDVRGRCPRPLDDGTFWKNQFSKKLQLIIT